MIMLNICWAINWHIVKWLARVYNQLVKCVFCVLESMKQRVPATSSWYVLMVYVLESVDFGMWWWYWKFHWYGYYWYEFVLKVIECYVL